MSLAVIRTGGKQFRVEKGAKVRVPALKHDVGAKVDLEVLASVDGKNVQVGAEVLKATATVLDHGRAPKIVVFKKKRRKHYKRTKGHRQGYTTLKIESIG